MYEIGDPQCYQLPDVNCDFSKVEMEEVDVAGGGCGVFIAGAKGKPPSDTYKVSRQLLWQLMCLHAHIDYVSFMH